MALCVHIVWRNAFGLTKASKWSTTIGTTVWPRPQPAVKPVGVLALLGVSRDLANRQNPTK